jgi:hypothetical protein
VFFLGAGAPARTATKANVGAAAWPIQAISDSGRKEKCAFSLVPWRLAVKIQTRFQMKQLSKLEKGGGGLLYQLKITLKWSKPPIWRRVVVRADMTLDRLHEVIQMVMPWTDSHMHHFFAGGAFYGKSDPEFAEMGGETLNEKRYKLADLAPGAKKKFDYEYDFGDGWQHEVIVEKVLPSDAAFRHPTCLAGANACPPDDCGGMGGYYNLLEALAKPKHPEHDDLKEWIGGEWDAALFDLKAANDRLKRLKA